MYSKFLDKKRLIVNSADSNEQLVLADFIERANSGKYELVVDKLLDINGDVTGICIELIKKTDALSSYED